MGIGPRGGERGGVSTLPIESLVLHLDFRLPVFSPEGSFSSFDSVPEREDKLDAAE